MYNWFSRCSTARGSGTRFSLVDPTKVKACVSRFDVKKGKHC